MSTALPKLFVVGLVFLHAGLLVWALMGFAEWFRLDVPWPHVANPLFPRGVLLTHWTSVLVTASLFLGGLALRWQATPTAVACGYVAMATVCLIETTSYLVHDARWLAMGFEYAVYVAIAWFLFRSAWAQAHFGGGVELTR